MVTQFLKYNENLLSEEWTRDIVEYLQSYYGKSKSYNKLYKLIKEVVDMAISAKSFNSFGDFLGYHNPKYHEINKVGNYKNLWWGTISYLLDNTEVIEKDGVDEIFMRQVIDIMDSVIDERQGLFEDYNNNILYHATNYTWTKPEIVGLGFHAGTLKAAKDRLKSFSAKINPHIKMLRMNLKNPLYIGRDYRFHNNLTKVATELYKDGIINKEEKNDFCRVYDDNATFANLRNLLHDKYGYDGIIYRNNIEDRGSNSYIAFYPEQIELLGNL